MYYVNWAYNGGLSFEEARLRWPICVRKHFSHIARIFSIPFPFPPKAVHLHHALIKMTNTKMGKRFISSQYLGIWHLAAWRMRNFLSLLLSRTLRVAIFHFRMYLTQVEQ